MHLTDGEDILVADDAAQFAEKVVQLHQNPELWARLSKNSLKNVEKHFSKETARRNLEELLAELDVVATPSAETTNSTERADRTQPRKTKQTASGEG
jgi:hypothetical protein